jgi:hypothetical protein
MRDEQVFGSGIAIAKAAGEKLLGGFAVGDFQSRSGTLKTHPILLIGTERFLYGNNIRNG